jgi:general secretion pathway protein M
MKAWWRSRSPAAQLAFAALGGAALVALAWWGVLRPLQDWRAAEANEQLRLARDWQGVQELAAELRQLRSDPARAATGAMRVPLSTLVEQSLEGRPFRPSRLQLNEAGQMQLRLDAVVFDEALAWLHELERYPGVLATAVSVSGVEGGRVSLGLTLQQL